MKNLCIAVLLFSGLVHADWKSETYQTLKDVESVYKALNSDIEFSEEQIEMVLSRAKVIETEDGVRKTPAGRPLIYFTFGQGQVRSIWVGGVHADEFVPSYATWRLMIDYLENPSFEPMNHKIVFIPFINLDGLIDGHRKKGYPTRNSGRNIDLNRSFYNRKSLPNYQSQPEVEFVMDLLERHNPEFWVAPHAALGFLDIDGDKSHSHKDWWETTSEATSEGGGPQLPMTDFRVYAPPGSLKNWSLGKLVTEWKSIYSTRDTSAITYEFAGPGKRPSRNDPDRAMKILKRKQLGRFEDNTHLAAQYYSWYWWSLRASLELLPESEKPIPLM